jgi:hypothetical protein
MSLFQTPQAILISVLYRHTQLHPTFYLFAVVKSFLRVRKELFKLMLTNISHYFPTSFFRMKKHAPFRIVQHTELSRAEPFEQVYTYVNVNKKSAKPLIATAWRLHDSASFDLDVKWMNELKTKMSSIQYLFCKYNN